MLTVDCDLLGIRAGEHVLDVGCGEGRHACQASREKGCTICALDIDQANALKTAYLLDLMAQHGESTGSYAVLRGDALRLPFRDAHFDRVICSEVLEHVPDDRQAAQELVRVMKDDGTLAVSVPTYFSESVYWRLSADYHHCPGGHIRRYRFRELASLLRACDLRITAVRRKHALHFPYWLLRCLFGIDRDAARIPALYHRFLVWDIMNNPRPIRLLEGMLNPLFAKSVVVYARKNAETRPGA